RLTQAMGQPRRGVRHWYQTGPAGFVLRLVRGNTEKNNVEQQATLANAQ
ncbi:MAG: proline/glycine betaine ABC transporter permease ProW, partial [Janthinobacterium sp.]